MLSFGTYPAVSLSDARSKRNDAKVQLKNNIDPALVKQRQKDKRYEAAANSFSAIAEELQIDLDNWLDYYNNERTHQGKKCCGRTPMETLLDGKQIWKEKFVN